jgi:hypothetical protein
MTDTEGKRLARLPQIDIPRLQMQGLVDHALDLEPGTVRMTAGIFLTSFQAGHQNCDGRFYRNGLTADNKAEAQNPI